MMARFVQDGEAVDFVPTADAKAGDVVLQNDLIGVVKTDTPAGRPGALAVVGVFEFPKITGSGQAIAFGSKVYWDATGKYIRKNGVTPYVGKAVEAAGDNALTVRVRLEQ
jgi:predicted RecA/RadA family phage recombinase